VISILIALSRNFQFVDNWLAKLVEAYGYQDRKSKNKLTALEMCARDLERVNSFEKSGKKNQLRIIHQPRG